MREKWYLKQTNKKNQRPAIALKVAFLTVMCFVNANYPNDVWISLFFVFLGRSVHNVSVFIFVF